MKTYELLTDECQQRLFNGTLCRRPVVGTVPLDFTDERKPVCQRHLRCTITVHLQINASAVACGARGTYSPLPGDITLDPMRVTCPDCKAGRRSRCEKHPAYEPDYCPLCGTAAVIR